MLKKEKGGSRLNQQAKDKPKRTKQEVIRHRLFVAATAVSGVIVLAFIAAQFIFVKPELPTQTERPQPTAGLDGEEPAIVSSDRKENFWTFLVIGRDTGGGGNTDTMLLAAYDIENQKLNVMSIPRDTMVNYGDRVRKINGVYNVAGRGEEGLAALDQEITELLGFAPDFRIVVEWKAVGELVEALGGVWFDVPRDMYYYDPTQDLLIDVDAGYQKLNGDKAMQVVRFRDGVNGYRNGDLGRIETQQAFLKAVVEQCLQIENIVRINELAKVFTENVTTELTVNNLAWFAQQAIFGGLDMENVNFFTMPNESAAVWSSTYQNFQSYVVADREELIEVVNAYLNPYKDDLQLSELDLAYVDSNGVIRTTKGANLGSALRPASANTPAPTPAPTPTPSTGVESPSPDPGTTPVPTVSPEPVETASPPPETSVTPPPEEGEQTPVPTTQVTPAPTSTPTSSGGPPEGIPILTPPPAAGIGETE